jgi:chemotaxis protein methyltransferase CheR
MAATMSPPPELTEIELDLFLEAFFRRYRHDFRRYARPTLRRRLQLALEHFGCESLSLLQHVVLRDASKAAEMLGYLTVQVSDLFRDPGYYLALRQQVLPLLATYPSLKVWVAGCGAGEELYSLAILLHEEGLLRRTMLYATDVNGEALRRADLGVYAIDRARAFSENYRLAGGKASLSDYYTSAYDGIVFDRQLRENVVFSDHSLATDSVFAEVQLVSCRNVLIYFDAELKNRAVGLFHDSLARKGFLTLGARENLRGMSSADHFVQIDRANRIYRKQ